MKRYYVRDIQGLEVGDALTDVFLVRRKQVRQTRRGDDYLDLTLADRSGEISAKIWSNSDAMGVEFDRGDYVEVEAIVGEYDDSKQLVVEKLRRIDAADVALEDFVPSCSQDIEGMLERLKQMAQSVSNTYLRALLDVFFDDGEFIERFKRSSGAARLHHAYAGGLLEHTLSVVGLADLMCRHYPDIDRDLLIAAAILHDIGKVEEIAWDGTGFEYTVRGRFLGHTVLGLEIVSRMIDAVEDFPEPLKLELLHVIASHHGEAQFGAPREPVTKEALLLHYLDNIDAKLQMAGSAIEDATDEVWSDYSKGLRRVVYREGKEGYSFRWPEAPDAATSGEDSDSRADASGEQSADPDEDMPSTLFDDEER